MHFQVSNKNALKFLLTPGLGVSGTTLPPAVVLLVLLLHLWTHALGSDVLVCLVYL